MKLTQALKDVLAERQRQVEVEGFSAGHDEALYAGSLAEVAACYAAPEVQYLLWPDSWDKHWWKPTTRRRDLVKAGALILAEIERLDRDYGK